MERECPLLEAVKNLDSLSREIGEKNVRVDFDIFSVFRAPGGAKSLRFSPKQDRASPDP